jgi:hypothetical protein
MTALRLERAREADAPFYADEPYHEAEVALAEAHELVAEKRYLPAIQAASLASLRADEAHAQAQAERRKLIRKATRLLHEAEAILDEARSLGVEETHPAKLEAFTSRLATLKEAVETGPPSQAHEIGGLLKEDLLDFVGELKQKGTEQK